MTVDYESGREAFEELVKLYGEEVGERNEATTRLQMIDRLFFECLGWDKDDVVVEEQQAGEFADYTFSLMRRVLIVEAKKEGVWFDVPVEKEQMEYSLRSLVRESEGLKEAVKQAAGYCQSRGVELGAVCNGRQMVAFVATRSDGQPPLEGRALVFPSFEFMLEHFKDLWRALGRSGVEEEHLRRRLLGEQAPRLPPKLSERVLAYPGVKDRNIFQTELQILSDIILEDVTGSRELEGRFLSECYCKSGALSQYSLASKIILQGRYAALFDAEAPGPTTVPITTKDGITPDLFEDIPSRRPIILIGDVGVGKTTFIRNLIKVDAVDEFANAVTIYIDLGSQATLSADLRSFIVREVENQLLEEEGIDILASNFVRAVYNLDLERFRKGIFGELREADPKRYREKEIAFLEERQKDKEEHLRKSLYHLAMGRRKQIVVFLDNADQRDDATQQEAFLIGQEMAEHWVATVFIALRPDTFHRSMKSGVLSGYHPKAFTVAPPRIDLVVSKRLEFAVRLASGELPVRTLTGGTMTRLVTLEKMLRVFLESLERSRGLVECIDNLAEGNVRRALNWVRWFFGSGHVDTEKIVRIYEEQGSYYVPLHEFLRSVIFGDAEYYDPRQSAIVNLFDISRRDGKEYFLLGVLIGFLVNEASAGRADEGFVETRRVYEELQGLGFAAGQVDYAVLRGLRGKLVESGTRSMPEGDRSGPRVLRATSSGYYHVKDLSHRFVYVSAVIVDTPILDRATRDEIRDVSGIEPRLDRVEIFAEYLMGEWLRFVGQNGLEEDAIAVMFDWKEVYKRLLGDVRRIRQRVKTPRD